MVSQEGTHFTRHPSRKKASLGAGRESPKPIEERVYIEQGHPRVTSLQWAMSAFWWLHFTICKKGLIGPCCSCSAPVPTERLTHGIPFED